MTMPPHYFRHITMRANPLFRVAIEVTRRFTKSAGEMVLTHLG